MAQEELHCYKALAAKNIEKVDTLVKDVDQMELTLAQTFKLWKVILLLEQAYTNALEYMGKPTKNGKLTWRDQKAVDAVSAIVPLGRGFSGCTVEQWYVKFRVSEKFNHPNPHVA